MVSVTTLQKLLSRNFGQLKISTASFNKTTLRKILGNNLARNNLPRLQLVRQPYRRLLKEIIAYLVLQ